jgi:hypothetical protein
MEQRGNAAHLRVHVTTEIKPRFVAICSKCGVYFSMKHRTKVPVSKFHSCFTVCCRSVCESQLFHMVDNAAVLLHFVLTVQTRPLAVQVEPRLFLNMFPTYHECRPVFPHHGVFGVFSSYLVYIDLSLGTLSSICKLLSCFEHRHQQTFVEFTTILLGPVFSRRLLQKHAMFFGIPLRL